MEREAGLPHTVDIWRLHIITQPGQKAFLGCPTIHIVRTNKEPVGNLCCSIWLDRRVCLLSAFWSMRNHSPLLGVFQSLSSKLRGHPAHPVFLPRPAMTHDSESELESNDVAPTKLVFQDCQSLDPAGQDSIEFDQTQASPVQLAQPNNEAQPQGQI